MHAMKIQPAKNILLWNKKQININRKVLRYIKTQHKFFKIQWWTFYIHTNMVKGRSGNANIEILLCRSCWLFNQFSMVKININLLPQIQEKFGPKSAGNNSRSCNVGTLVPVLCHLIIIVCWVFINYSHTQEIKKLVYAVLK